MRQINCSLLVVAAATAAMPATVSAAISITSFGTAYTEDFNTLAIVGTTNTALPTGWALHEVGSSSAVNQQYAAGTGSDSAGDVYSFGAGGSTERAFGTLFSGTNTPTIGASFTNNAGGTLTTLDISYTGEMWRAGVTDRGAADRLDFQYSLDATSLTTGTWIDVDGLDFNSPNVNATAGALNGNSAANQASLTQLITGLSISNGITFWIRWNEFNISPGADDGLAVDDFSLTARGDIASVPEPGTLALLGLGLGFAGLTASRRRKH